MVEVVGQGNEVAVRLPAGVAIVLGGVALQAREARGHDVCHQIVVEVTPREAKEAVKRRMQVHPEPERFGLSFDCKLAFSEPYIGVEGKEVQNRGFELDDAPEG